MRGGMKILTTLVVVCNLFCISSSKLAVATFREDFKKTKCFGDRDVGMAVVAVRKELSNEMCGQYVTFACVGPPMCKNKGQHTVAVVDECPPNLSATSNDICISRFLFNLLADTSNDPTRMVVNVTGPLYD